MPWASLSSIDPYPFAFPFPLIARIHWHFLFIDSQCGILVYCAPRIEVADYYLLLLLYITALKLGNRTHYKVNSCSMFENAIVAQLLKICLAIIN